MNVVFFSNHFVEPRGHGIARYAHELSASVEASHRGINVRRVASRKGGLPDRSGSSDSGGVIRIPWGRELTTAAWWTLGGPALERWVADDIDVVHSLALGYPVQTRKPLVVTVHDIGPLTHPEYFPKFPRWVMKRGVKHLCHRADAVVCVSKATADELQDYLRGVHEIGERIHVVHEGISPHFHEGPHENEDAGFRDLGLPSDPFFLCVGATNPRKNLGRVVKAFNRVAESVPHHLVLVGGSSVPDLRKSLGPELTRFADRFHSIGYISESQLVALYRRATALVYVSLFEGFGLPILEAMAAGCPVVASRINPLVEIGGNAAVLVDPSDVDEIGAAMKLFATDTSISDRFRNRGKELAVAFSWARCSEQTIEVYRQVIASGRSIRG